MDFREEFASETPERGWGFYAALGLLFVFVLMAFGTDYDIYTQHSRINVPLWYNRLTFFVDGAAAAMLLLISYYRKAGVWLYPVVIILHFILHNYYLSTFLYTDVTNIFLFITIGLLVILPKWKFYH